LTESVTWDQVRAFRLTRHGLVQRRPADRLVDVVQAICGLQAPVQSAADLQLPARLDGLKPTDVRRAPVLGCTDCVDSPPGRGTTVRSAEQPA
jgi:hypothetical protein